MVQAPSLPDHPHAAQGGQTRGHMHDQPAAKIERAKLLDPAAGPPDPVRDRVVDERRPEHREDQVRRELHPLDDRPGNEGHCKNRHEQLEEHEELVRYQRGHRRVRGDPDSLQEQPLPATAETAQHTPAECQAVAEQEPLERNCPQQDESLLKRRQHILAACHSAVEVAQGRYHRQRERTAEHDHDGVGGLKRQVRRRAGRQVGPHRARAPAIVGRLLRPARPGTAHADRGRHQGRHEHPPDCVLPSRHGLAPPACSSDHCRPLCPGAFEIVCGQGRVVPC